MADEEKKTIAAKVSSAKCEGCGGDMFFSPKDQQLRCPNCDSLQGFPINKMQNKHPISEPDEKGNHDKWVAASKTFKCPTCGANVEFNGPFFSGKCEYCECNYVIDTKTLEGTRPDVLIPFAFDEKEAAIRFAKSVKKKFFAPRKFKKAVPESDVRGVYVPCFTFDADTFTRYNGILTKTYTVRDSKGNTHTEVKLIPISGTNSMEHRDYVVESSSHLNGKDIKALLPYHMDDSCLVSSDFIRGYDAEHYADPMEDCYKIAQKEIEAKIKSNILSKYSYSGVKTFNMDVDYSEEMYSYRFLPVYFLTLMYKQKKYIVQVNGQTGKLGGGYPKSALKIALTIALGVIVVAALVVLLFLLAAQAAD
ncbi:MAG: hypothetical protein MJ239_07680 [Bacilli bacterium]|nr:hypothetical protein [Bacilli bacterium]